MDEVPNIFLPMVFTVFIPNLSTLRILIEEGSSDNVLYFKIFIKLDLTKQYLKPCEGQSLLVFKESSTRPCKWIYLSITLRAGNRRKKVKTCFFVVPSDNVYNSILNRPFMAPLDVVASYVHMKLKCNYDQSWHQWSFSYIIWGIKEVCSSHHRPQKECRGG